MNRLAALADTSEYPEATDWVTLTPKFTPTMDPAMRPQFGLRRDRSPEWKYYQTFEKNEIVDLAASIYRVQEGITVSISQLFIMLGATVLFAISVSCVGAAILFSEMSNVAPWFFWLIPTVGSSGIVVGMLVNLTHRHAKKTR